MWRWAFLGLLVVGAVALLIVKNAWTRLAGIAILAIVAGWAFATGRQPGGFAMFSATAAAQGAGALEALKEVDTNAKRTAGAILDNPQMGKG